MEKPKQETSRISAATVIITTEVKSDEENLENDEENYGDLALTRTTSGHTPPELIAESYSVSEDEHMPPSPSQPAFGSFTENQRQAITATSLPGKKNATLSATEQETLVHDFFYLPARQQPTMVAAF